MEENFLTLNINDGPLVATAIHNGHLIRDELVPLLKLSEAERLREEDPFTSDWVTVGDTRIIVNRSRFEVDLNRARDKAVYRNPEDAWGLDTWHIQLEEDIVNRSLNLYDKFYATLNKQLKSIESRYGKFVVFDIHSYNHRRNRSNKTQADPKDNPEINIGTSNMNETIWRPLVNRFINDLKSHRCEGRQLDVRENIKFKGGHMARCIHNNFPNSGLALAIEVKKFYMDEWTGRGYQSEIDFVGRALVSTINGVLQELEKLQT